MLFDSTRKDAHKLELANVDIQKFKNQMGWHAQHARNANHHAVAMKKLEALAYVPSWLKIRNAHMDSARTIKNQLQTMGY